MNYIPVACSFFYGIGFGLPIVLHILMRFLFGLDIPMMVNICIYGYSYTVLIPILFLCIIPFELFKVLLLAYGLISSTVFLVYNMYKVIEQKSGNSKYIVLGLIIGCQVVMYMMLKFYFFAESGNEKTTLKSNNISN